MKVYQKIHSLSIAIDNCIKSGNTLWQERHENSLNAIMEDSPSGSGFDDGTTLYAVEQTKMVFETSFHHLNNNGYYEGWTKHYIYVKPTFDGIDLRITGQNRNDIKEYISDVFYTWLNSEID